VTAATDRRPFLALLGPVLRSNILRHYTPDSCVASTAIGKLVLDHLEIPSEPVSLRAMLANHAWMQRAEREKHLPQDAEERERWFTESGAHAIGLGVPDSNWAGHPLVNGLHLGLLVDGGWLWDLSIDQASRPQHGIVIKEPFLGDVSKSPNRQKFLQGKHMLTWEAPGHGLVAYTVKPDDKRYLEHPNWRTDEHGTDVETRTAVAADTILAMRGMVQIGLAAH
jgi:hypothetical protein